MPKISIESFLYSDDLDDLFTSSSSDYDSECECKNQTSKTLDEISNNMSDSEFQIIFRVSKNTFKNILELLQAEKNSLLNCCERVKLEHALLIVLNFLGNQNTIKDISAEFNLPKSCTHSIISSAVNYFSSNMPISMPKSQHFPQLSERLKKLCQLENVVGILGNTEVRIQDPVVNSERYLSCSGDHTIQIQGVLSADHRFLDFSIQEGSLSTADVFKKSTTYKEVQNGLFEKYRLIGLNSYGLNGIVTRLPESNIMTGEQIVFNKRHQIALEMAKKSFALLKERFSRLKNKFNSDDVEFVSQCVTTACIFHNLCINFHDQCNFYADDLDFIDYSQQL